MAIDDGEWEAILPRSSPLCKKRMFAKATELCPLFDNHLELSHGQHTTMWFMHVVNGI